LKVAVFVSLNENTPELFALVDRLARLVHCGDARLLETCT
jgi:hypothetical protein